MQTIVREIRGIPFFLLQEYLEELGGVSSGEGQVQGSGWQARLERMESFRLGSLTVGQTRMEIQIEEQIADEFMRRLSLKTMRAGA